MKKILIGLCMLGLLAFIGCGNESVNNVVESDYDSSEVAIGSISIDQLLVGMPTEFSIENGDDWDFTGVSERGLARLDLTGTEDDLTEVILTTALKINGNEEASKENTLIVVTLLQNTVPGDDPINWLVPVLEMYSAEGAAYDKTTFGDREVEAMVDKEGILYLIITL